MAEVRKQPARGAARTSPLLNYSTRVSADQTIAEIHAALRAHHSRAITTEYTDSGEPWAVHFRYTTEFGERDFRLPVGIDAVHRLIQELHAAGKIAPVGFSGKRISESEFLGRAHAVDVAWRIVKDWLEAQLALLQSQQVKLEQVMLPYMLGAGDVTVYEALRQNEMKALKEGHRA